MHFACMLAGHELRRHEMFEYARPTKKARARDDFGRPKMPPARRWVARAPPTIAPMMGIGRRTGAGRPLPPERLAFAAMPPRRRDMRR